MPLSEPDPQRHGGHPAGVADDDLLFRFGEANARTDRPGRGHAGAAGCGQPGAAFVGADEDLFGGEREQHRQVGPGGEDVWPGRHPLPHRHQVGLDVVLDDGDQVRVRHRHGGERQGRIEFGQACLDQRAPAGRHRDVEGDGGLLEHDLLDALLGRRPAPYRVLDLAAADHGGVGAAPVEHDPAQAAHAVAAELGGRAVRVEEPGLGHRQGRVVEVDAVAAERARPVAQVADERAEVGLRREVSRGEVGDEDVVPRPVRVQDLGHRWPSLADGA